MGAGGKGCSRSPLWQIGEPRTLRRCRSSVVARTRILAPTHRTRTGQLNAITRHFRNRVAYQFSQTVPEGFFPVPQRPIDDGSLATLSASACKLWILLLRGVQQTSSPAFTVSTSELSHVTGMDEKTIRRSRAELVSLGWLRHERERLGAIRYHLSNPTSRQSLPLKEGRNRTPRWTPTMSSDSKAAQKPAALRGKAPQRASTKNITQSDAPDSRVPQSASSGEPHYCSLRELHCYRALPDDSQCCPECEPVLTRPQSEEKLISWDEIGRYSK